MPLIIITLQDLEPLHMSLKSVNRERIIYDQKFNHKNDSYYETYELGKPLGKGGFAHVYEVFKSNEISPVRKAAKVLCLKDKASNNKEKIQTEIKLMQVASQNSDCFVKYYHNFTYSDKVYIIMELCEWGSLGDIVKKRKTLTEPEVRFFIQQLVQILMQLKKKGIVHRDIKPANIMISSNFKFKLGDFGLAIAEADIIKVKTMCGTPNYLAPEVINKKVYSYEVDLWAMGVMMFSILYGIAPFQTRSVNQTYQRIKKGVFKFEGPNKSVRVSQDAKALIKDILKIQPRQRIKLEEIFMHPFFCSYEIPRKLDKELMEMAPSPQFVRKYSKKIITKNQRKNIEFSPQNISDTMLQKREPPIGKVTYRNCLNPRPFENDMPTLDFRLAKNKIKVQQIIDLELSKVETSTSVRKRPLIHAEPSPAPKKYFRNNGMVKIQAKIEEPQQLPNFFPVKTQQPEIIIKRQEVVHPQIKIQEPPRAFNLKKNFIELDCSPDNIKIEYRSRLNYNYNSGEQFIINSRQSQEQNRFLKARPATVIWEKLLQNGDFLYKLSNQHYGVRFTDRTEAMTKDFEAIRFSNHSEKDQDSPEKKTKLDDKKALLRQYQKYYPLKLKIKLEPFEKDEPVNFLKEFAFVDLGRFFIFDKGILQFRHEDGWFITHMQRERYSIYEYKQQAELIHVNGINLHLLKQEVRSRYLQFMQIAKGLSYCQWTYNVSELKEERLEETKREASEQLLRLQKLSIS